MANFFTVNGKKYEGTKENAKLDYENRSDFYYKLTFEDWVEAYCEPVFEPVAFTEAERKFLDYQYALSGSFYRSLVQTIMHADEPNKYLLSKAYPELVEVVRRYQNEDGYWQQLEARWSKFIGR